MKVAIVHYHLKPGGVTRVIENTLLAWKQGSGEIDTVVLSGRPYSGVGINNNRIVDGLDYAGPSVNPNAAHLLKSMIDQAKDGLGCIPDLWHIHNHSLGKNPTFTQAVALLAGKGHKMLLHIHDFAEDGRPENYLALNEVYHQTFPTSPQIHYAVLNHRDFSFLKVLLKDSESSVHLLANAIPANDLQNISLPVKSYLPKNLILYPVRAVRRKNLGELAFLSVLYPEKHFANSLGPTNPKFLPEFQKWKRLVDDLNLPVSFGLAEEITCSFQDMVGHADAIISTSIAEGFGLGFLEPWTFGKALYGRNIEEITKDFTQLGIELGHLYDRLEVDLDLLDEPKNLMPTIDLSLNEYYSYYGKQKSKDMSLTAYESMVRNGRVDFGRLNESLQKQIIKKVCHSPNQIELIRAQVDLNTIGKEQVSSNHEAVSRNFALKNYGEKVLGIYQRLQCEETSSIKFADGQKLLSCFLRPSRLNLLRA